MMDRRRALMSVAGSESSPYEHGTWDDLFWQIDHGTYATAYSVGEVLPLDLGTEGAIGARIVAFNADSRPDNQGTAAVSFVSEHCLNTSRRYNPALEGESGNYTVGTGNIGGWEYSELRTYCNNTILSLIPSAISRRIVTVKKYSLIHSTAGAKVNNVETIDSIFVPSNREIFNSGSETQGVTYYNSAFATAQKRIKTKPSASTATSWFLRSASTNSSNQTQAMIVGATGNVSSQAVSSKYGIAIGFCIN